MSLAQKWADVETASRDVGMDEATIRAMRDTFFLGTKAFHCEHVEILERLAALQAAGTFSEADLLARLNADMDKLAAESEAEQGKGAEQARLNLRRAERRARRPRRRSL